MNRREIYLDKRRDVDVMRYLQRLQRIRKAPVVIKHATLAERTGWSESSVRRSINALVAGGHILRTHLARGRGGRLCVYRVNTSAIYRQASLFRRATRAIEQLWTEGKPAPEADSSDSQKARCKDLKVNDLNNNRPQHRPQPNHRGNRPSDGNHLSDLMMVAKAEGIDDTQRGYLRAAALRYGVKRAWTALLMAHERGYALADLVKVTWGILKRQERIPS